LVQQNGKRKYWTQQGLTQLVIDIKIVPELHQRVEINALLQRLAPYERFRHEPIFSWQKTS
jgi:hypothetical protein